MGKRKNVIPPPALPPETPDEEFQISDEDMEFFSENPKFTNFLTRIDKKQIDRHVTRLANKSEDEVERLYERKNRNAAPLDSLENDLHVDPVDALPIKTLDGKLQYMTNKKVSTREGKADTESAEEDDDLKSGTIRLTKAERRVKLKKERKDTKKLNKDENIAPDSPKEKLQSEVLVICFSKITVIKRKNTESAVL